MSVSAALRKASREVLKNAKILSIAVKLCGKEGELMLFDGLVVPWLAAPGDYFVDRLLLLRLVAGAR